MGRFPIAPVVAVVALAACSGGGEEPVTAGCHIGALGVCSSYPGGAPAGFELGCHIDGGTIVAACPVEGRLGTCVFTVDAGGGGAPITASVTWYPGVLATPAEAADVCADLSGEFTAGTAQAGAATERWGGSLLPAGTSCPTAGRAGTCRTAVGALTRIEEVRHYDPATVAADAAGCPYGWIAG